MRKVDDPNSGSTNWDLILFFVSYTLHCLRHKHNVAPYKASHVCFHFSFNLNISITINQHKTYSIKSMAGVKLLGFWASPYANRVQIALNLKSISYEYIEQNLRSKSQLLLESNPVHKKVPVLIHGDNPVSESLVILEYIDEVWTQGPSILPSDPHDRAVARFWAAYITDKVFLTL